MRGSIIVSLLVASVIATFTTMGKVEWESSIKTLARIESTFDDTLALVEANSRWEKAIYPAESDLISKRTAEISELRKKMEDISEELDKLTSLNFITGTLFGIFESDKVGAFLALELDLNRKKKAAIGDVIWSLRDCTKLRE